MLGEHDVALRMQIALDTLINEYVTDPGIAHRTRRATRGQL